MHRQPAIFAYALNAQSMAEITCKRRGSVSYDNFAETES